MSTHKLINLDKELCLALQSLCTEVLVLENGKRCIAYFEYGSSVEVYSDTGHALQTLITLYERELRSIVEQSIVTQPCFKRAS